MTNAEALEVLRKVEWADYDTILYCVFCENRKNYGHKPDCKLAELIRDQEAVVSEEDELKWHNIECFERADAERGGDA